MYLKHVLLLIFFKPDQAGVPDQIMFYMFNQVHQPDQAQPLDSVYPDLFTSMHHDKSVRLLSLNGPAQTGSREWNVSPKCTSPIQCVRALSREEWIPPVSIDSVAQSLHLWHHFFTGCRTVDSLYHGHPCVHGILSMVDRVSTSSRVINIYELGYITFLKAKRKGNWEKPVLYLKGKAQLLTFKKL